MAMITAYHVSAETKLRVVERSVCNDPKRDGLLRGANVACFTTTLYRGRFPTQSPYPRTARDGDTVTVYRYVMHFNPRDYIKFKMAQSKGQVHYLLLENSDEDERELAEQLRRRIPSREDEDWDSNFANGRANDYATSKVFVNVVFWHDVRVENTRGAAIVKRGPWFSYPAVDAMDSDEWLRGIPYETATDSSSEDEEEEPSSGSEDSSDATNLSSDDEEVEWSSSDATELSSDDDEDERSSGSGGSPNASDSSDFDSDSDAESASSSDVSSGSDDSHSDVDAITDALRRTRVATK